MANPIRPRCSLCHGTAWKLILRRHPNYNGFTTFAIPCACRKPGYIDPATMRDGKLAAAGKDA